MLFYWLSHSLMRMYVIAFAAAQLGCKRILCGLHTVRLKARVAISPLLIKD